MRLPPLRFRRSTALPYRFGLRRPRLHDVTAACNQLQTSVASERLRTHLQINGANQGVHRNQPEIILQVGRSIETDLNGLGQNVVAEQQNALAITADESRFTLFLLCAHGHREQSASSREQRRFHRQLPGQMHRLQYSRFRSSAGSLSARFTAWMGHRSYPSEGMRVQVEDFSPLGPLKNQLAYQPPAKTPGVWRGLASSSRP
jgi:hypothetical protein